MVVLTADSDDVLDGDWAGHNYLGRVGRWSGGVGWKSEELEDEVVNTFAVAVGVRGVGQHCQAAGLQGLLHDPREAKVTGLVLGANDVVELEGAVEDADLRVGNKLQTVHGGDNLGQDRNALVAQDVRDLLCYGCVCPLDLLQSEAHHLPDHRNAVVVLLLVAHEGVLPGHVLQPLGNVVRQPGVIRAELAHGLHLELHHLTAGAAAEAFDVALEHHQPTLAVHGLGQLLTGAQAADAARLGVLEGEGVGAGAVLGVLVRPEALFLAGAAGTRSCHHAGGHVHCIVMVLNGHVPEGAVMEVPLSEGGEQDGAQQERRGRKCRHCKGDEH
mmetsp:Transcript_10625/g.18845  ORF Transcript_10625/g.18845 Transcript_10625/m.18845 type:complete len:329 (+) Transcript_10625:1455-2441(+)